MPYPGIPTSKDKEMEKCVSEVMAQGEHDKSSAIAICHNAIMGGKKSKKGEFMPAINLNFYGDYWKEVLKNDDSATVEGNVDVEVKEIIKKDDQVETDNQRKEVKNMEKAKDVKEEKCKVCGAMVAESEMKAHMAEHEKEDKKEDDSEKKVEKTEVKVEEKKDQPVFDQVAAAKMAEGYQMLVTKIDEILASNKVMAEKLEKSAITEGAAPKTEEVKDAPKGEVAEASKEVKTVVKAEDKGDVSPEGADSEVGQALSKVSDSISKVAERIEKFDTRFVELEKRLKTIEDQPAPSKVASSVVVSKADLMNSLSSDKQAKVNEIDKKLADLEVMKATQLDRFQAQEMWKVAWRLQDEKDAILMG